MDKGEGVANQRRALHGVSLESVVMDLYDKIDYLGAKIELINAKNRRLENTVKELKDTVNDLELTIRNKTTYDNCYRSRQITSKKD